MISNPSVYGKSVSSLDIFSTIAAVAKAGLPTDRRFDGVNLFPFLSNDSSAPHELLFWRSGYSKAVCKGDWKLYVNEKDGRKYLFNLIDDIGEKRDLSKTHADKLNELMKALEQWEKTQTVKPAWPSASDVSIDVDGEVFHFPT
jgi:arylsulfatase A-like enzyme